MKDPAGVQFLKNETDKWKRSVFVARDFVDVALKVAEERHQIELKIRDALLAGDDEQLRHFARLLLRLSHCHVDTPDPKGARRNKQKAHFRAKKDGR
jgi:hypothetical protein